jgi:hypothetical protein
MTRPNGWSTLWLLVAVVVVKTAAVQVVVVVY